MARYCVDASAVLAWLIPVQRTGVVREFWAGLDHAQDEIAAPALLYAECISVLREQVGSLLTQPEALAMLDDLFALPVSVRQERALYRRAMELADRLRRRRAYDMQYLAAAELANAELLTLDSGLYQAAIEMGLPARLLR